MYRSIHLALVVVVICRCQVQMESNKISDIETTGGRLKCLPGRQNESD